MRKSSRCQCAEIFQVHQCRAEEYSRVKQILNRGKHPAFIGRQMIQTYVKNGGIFVFTVAESDAACAAVNPKSNTLMVLNILPEHRSHGLGSAILRYLQANFARVVETAVPFFERNGYTPVGAMKRGNSLNTQVMIKSSLIPLAGRLAVLWGPK